MLAAAPERDGLRLRTRKIPLRLAQPTVSHHLRILREAGLVVGERRGKWVHYRVVPERLAEIRDSLSPLCPRVGVDHSSSISCRRVTVFQLRAVPLAPSIFSK